MPYPVQKAVVYVEFALLESREVVDIHDKVFDSINIVNRILRLFQNHTELIPYCIRLNIYPLIYRIQ